MTPTTERIYRIVSQIPKGFVATYGDIAKAAELGSARVVGNALHCNEDWKVIPCHRVVNAAGRLAPAFGMGGPSVQELRLKKEGVTFIRKTTADKPGVVDLKKHHWTLSKTKTRTT